MCVSGEGNCARKTGREQLNTYHRNHSREIRGESKVGAEGFQGTSGGDSKQVRTVAVDVPVSDEMNLHYIHKCK